MPLNDFQKHLARLLAQNRTEESHLAGGSALHLSDKSLRYSNDLDYFHDALELVEAAYQKDKATLEDAGFVVREILHQPGFVRVGVRGADNASLSTTKIEWVHDSAWRFLPVVACPETGYRLHPIDLAINKVCALVGRNEPRDLLDVIHAHKTILPLGALCWAVPSKDPGFTPYSLLELIRRRGQLRQEDVERLMLTQEVSLVELKETWLAAVNSAQTFIESRPIDEVGCLYLKTDRDEFFAPEQNDGEYRVHYGQPGGVIPQMIE